MGALQIAGKSVAIIGAGSQGRRLAYMWSSQGSPVKLIDTQTSQLDGSHAYIQGLRTAAARAEAPWGEVTTDNSRNLSKALQDAWLVIECVPEKLAIKRQVVLELSKNAPASAVIASNSSSYSISKVLEDLSVKNPERFLSLHCYWPPETPDIEIMGHPDTDPAILALIAEQCKHHGFVPFRVKGSSTGYIYNRIWAAIKRESLLVVAEGVADPTEVDAIFKSVLKTPKGPCEQMDVVGLDVVLDIEEHYAHEREGVPTAPRDYLRSMIAKGQLGIKSGEGFYKYGSDKSS